MTHSSILGGERAARRAAGKDADALGPSDSSDSGSDVQGEREMATRPDLPDELGAVPLQGDNDSDARGTGERGSATGRDAAEGADLLPDRIERPGTATDDDELGDAGVESLASDDDDDADAAEDDDDGRAT